MLLMRNLRRVPSIRFVRYASVHLDPTVTEAIDNGAYKPKDHPGKVKPKTIALPDRITDAIKKSVEGFPIKQLIIDGAALRRYLFSRHAPVKPSAVYHKKKQYQQEVLKKMGYNDISEIDDERTPKAKDYLASRVESLYAYRTYAWKPSEYDEYRSRVYAIGRSALEYSVVYRVFKEIAQRHPGFQPRSFFDFGAGVGTGTWAASELWKPSLYEYFLVDTSREMNELSDVILRDGNANKHLTLKNVYHRQFLPASSEISFNLVLSAYTLMELPTREKRIETLATLWNKCDGYLVLIEEGTNAGFKLINEARAYFAVHFAKTQSGFVYAPCPHEERCPRFMDGTKTPCNFLSSYNPLRVGEPENISQTRYSYVVIKRGDRKDEDASIDWPRVVRPVLVRPRHTVCRMCTHRGKLEEKVITKGKYPQATYRCVRKTEWGDRYPIIFDNEDKNEDDSSTIVSNEDEDEYENMSEDDNEDKPPTTNT